MPVIRYKKFRERRRWRGSLQRAAVKARRHGDYYCEYCVGGRLLRHAVRRGAMTLNDWGLA